METIMESNAVYSGGIRAEAGISKFASLVTILLFAVSIYLSLQVVTFYYNFAELEGLIQFQVKQAEGRTDKHIKSIIRTEMKKLAINAEAEELQLESGPDKISIALYYEEDLEIYINEDYNWVLHTFEFDIFEEGSVSSKRIR